VGVDPVPGAEHVRVAAVKFTFRELRLEAERELRLRMRVYPGRVACKRMSEGQADRQLALQQSIIDTLTELEKGERLL